MSTTYDSVFLSSPFDRTGLRPHRARPVPARGPCRVRAQPPAHLHDLRHRRGLPARRRWPGHTVHRHGTARGRAAACAACARALAGAGGRRDIDSAGGRARGRARQQFCRTRGPASQSVPLRRRAPRFERCSRALSLGDFRTGLLLMVAGGRAYGFRALEAWWSDRFAMHARPARPRQRRPGPGAGPSRP